MILETNIWYPCVDYRNDSLRFNQPTILYSDEITKYLIFPKTARKWWLIAIKMFIRPQVVFDWEIFLLHRGRLAALRSHGESAGTEKLPSEEMIDLCWTLLRTIMIILSGKIWKIREIFPNIFLYFPPLSDSRGSQPSRLKRLEKTSTRSLINFKRLHLWQGKAEMGPVLISPL